MNAIAREALVVEPISQKPQVLAPPKMPRRLQSLDAYRGFVMLLMMAEVLRSPKVAAALPNSAIWRFVAYHQTHVPWLGCSLHDLIQSSFSFIVGVALPFSLANRLASGESQKRLVVHACWRSLLLILLGVFLRSLRGTQTNWIFTDTLSQIGLGYPFLFLLAFCSNRAIAVAIGLILIGDWAAFALYPVPTDFDYSTVGLSNDWPHLLTGFSAHWNKNSNLGWAFDKWLLNLFPRQKPWRFDEFGSTTLNFVPTLAVMLFGLLAGRCLRSERSLASKARVLAVSGIFLLVAGWGFGASGICPVVKRIWTPSWSLYSSGWCFLLLAGFYATIEILELRKWSFPLVVIGMNSIAAYCIAHLFDQFIYKNLVTHLGQRVFRIFGDPVEPFLHGLAVLVVFWLLLLWLYRRKIFIKL